MSESITLPRFVTAKHADEVVAICRATREANGVVEVDASRLMFIDPFGLAMLGATFFTLREGGFEVRVSGLSAEIGGYLRRMDVFEGAGVVDGVAQPGRRSDRSDALLELTRLERTDNAESVAYRVAKALVGHIPDADPEESPDEMIGYNRFDRLVEPLQYALGELLKNALTHARRNGYHNANVWVASQYYPSKGLVRLGVVDNGCGFLGSLRGHPELRKATHLEAILTGLRPRVSCNRELGLDVESENQGVGLTTTQRIAKLAGGELVIVSGDGLYKTKGLSFAMGPGCNWQGVGIAMECRRNALVDVRYRDLLPRRDLQPPPKLRFE